ncbi:MAG TPA: hypothetical protein VG184_01045 [Acidimicrobiales bacterium]|nr:hypothetical protein [Acidimicrobiales bacterium]
MVISWLRGAQEKAAKRRAPLGAVVAALDVLAAGSATGLDIEAVGRAGWWRLNVSGWVVLLHRVAGGWIVVDIVKAKT